MSRHAIVLTSSTLNADVLVVAGYDRPLQNVFCQAHLAETASPPLYLSATDALRMNASSIDVFVEPLAELGVSLPQVVADNVMWDKQFKAGNLVYSYDKQGTLKHFDGDLLTLGPMIYDTARLHSKVLGREVLVAIGVQGNKTTRVFSYIGNLGQTESPFIASSRIGSAGDAELIYCTMTDSSRMRATQIEEVLAPLNDYGITVPPAMIDALQLQITDCRGESFTSHFSAEGELIDTDRGLDMCF